jgi:sorbitol-specific phosphotransferase system component IIC
MTCPLCHEPTFSIDINTTDGQITSIEECHNCGGHFLPPILVNFITTNTARNIDSIIPKATSIPIASPTCPHCHQNMSSIKDDSVPETVTVFSCPNNHGDFYPKNQLLLFKKAQDAKINYHKLWGIPLKSAFAVILPVLVIFTAITVIPNLIGQMQLNQENRVKAGEILTQPLITPISATEVLISFSTKNSVKTSITFTEGLGKTFDVSTTSNTNHLVSISELTPQTTYKYYITIDNGIKKVSTSEYIFSTP